MRWDILYLEQNSEYTDNNPIELTLKITKKPLIRIGIRNSICAIAQTAGMKFTLAGRAAYNMLHGCRCSFSVEEVKQIQYDAGTLVII